jgi:hypothetical protein
MNFGSCSVTFWNSTLTISWFQNDVYRICHWRAWWFSWKQMVCLLFWKWIRPLKSCIFGQNFQWCGNQSRLRRAQNNVLVQFWQRQVDLAHRMQRSWLEYATSLWKFVPGSD